MEEEADQSSCKATTREPALCEECKLNPSKYKCPGCSIRSCSLPCVKAHKQHTGCTGKRNRSELVPLSHFDDTLLLSDYNLLEDVKRVAESAQRTRTRLCGYAHFKLPFHLKSLQNAARSRQTRLLFLPSGMSKREKNKTRYDKRKKFISWTMEWRFHSTDIVLHDQRVHEDTSFCSILEKHLNPGPWNHQLRQFCDEHLDCLKLFICKHPKGPRLSFKKLNIKAPIRQQLANVVIVEFPVIHVFLPSQRINFEVIKDVNPIVPGSPPKDCESNQSQEGVSFKEEEIEEENGSSDPQVFDHMKHVGSSSLNQMPSQSKSCEKTLNDFADRPLFAGAGGNLSLSSLNSKELEFLENMEFEFDPSFMDAYSD
ncbi:Box C/D snoRNA protein 1 [Quillaja saponaria]|uniref:Box C/D snoRNA protein 1 n=1 Tax=Quillaja saponaria TaxID=32244 RepID=A0AAD7QIU5_QUISA|nr:Box C/D snoRNA protein 1 [Quillaja saponaria]KAJ7982160.1 Box C/D snoRNA protein 1 [Quillaja saponaria]